MDGTVVGVITWGLKLGQNLNFAASSNEVSSLVDRPSNAKPLSDVGQPSSPKSQAADEKELSLPNGIVWTSLVSGKDYRVRLDGDYIYTEWTNIPPDWSASAFLKGELKKTGTVWTGHGRYHFPCQYGLRINWITVDLGIEITYMTQTRIEGRVQNYSGYNCRTGKPKGEPTWSSFTWIPKA
jgi:hypothetical protein